ncbi:MAG: DUF922 domain-containing protein [Anaerolineae bacterium]|nr:DUF922 domain-containing protein [Anaerolineae bacterium]
MCEKCGCAKCHESVPQLEDEVERGPQAILDDGEMEAATGQDATAPLRRMIAPTSTPQQRQIATLQLQRQFGNAFVQRLLAGVQPVPIGAVQRWAMGLDAGAECSKIVPYINANSPYKPRWAKTIGTLQFDDSAGYTAAAEDEKKTKWSVTLPGAKVGYQGGAKGPTIDMPTWSPTNATSSKAWTAAMSQLQAHEDQHKNVLESDQQSIESTMQNHLESVSATTEDAAKATGKTKFWNQAQKEMAVVQPNQNKVDAGGAGCAAVIDCTEEESESAGAKNVDTGTSSANPASASPAA